MKTRKILYGIPSEGMGHATRSKVLIEHLLSQGHDVRIATSDRAYALMEKSFPGKSFRIEGLHLAYDEGRLDKSASSKVLLKALPKQLRTNFEQFYKVQRDFMPDIVISDFESFTYAFARINRIPLLSVDNMQVINRAKLDLKLDSQRRQAFLLAKAVVKSKLPYCKRYLIASFFDCEIAKKNTEIIPPILRPEILAAQSTIRSDGPVLVYQTASAQTNLITALQSLRKHRFRVYGYNREENHGNVELKAFSEAGFIRDLAEAACVITNGGFSLISEAVYLHKPICSFPLGGQFEQWLNGAMVEKMGYGRCFDAFDADAVKAFLYDLPDYQEALSGYHQNGNEVLFQKVAAFLEEQAP
jgi:uncharacterized protein (TIGR00661 family)